MEEGTLQITLGVFFGLGYWGTKVKNKGIESYRIKHMMIGCFLFSWKDND